MMQMRYKVIEIEGCECGQCDDETAYLVADETLTLQDLGCDHDESRILCNCFSRAGADLVVSALNRLATN